MCLSKPVENPYASPINFPVMALSPLMVSQPVEVPISSIGARGGSRRNKLWELNHRQHCPVIGTCLPMSQLRRLARRAGLDEAPITDYSLHVHAVNEAQQRNDFSEIMQRDMDKRFAPLVKRFSTVREATGLLALWRETTVAGEVAGALWAALTHSACDETTDKAIYGEIHMLSHQVGGGHRADLKRLVLLEAELARCLAESRRERERNIRRQSELELQLRSREVQLAEIRVVASEHEAVRRRLEAQGDDLQPCRNAEAEWRRRADAAEHKLAIQRGECIGLQRRINAADVAVQELQSELQVAEAVLGELCVQVASCGAAVCGPLSNCRACPGSQQAARLDGRCLLCIGGRENLVGHYRGLVEGLGGRFLHHDGGIEDNLKRLESTLISADAVVCQAGCVSHAAYWKLKEFCKRHNKPCVYLKRSGVTSFARGVELLVSVGTHDSMA